MLGFLFTCIPFIFTFLPHIKMEEKTMLPSGLYDVYIVLDAPIPLDDWKTTTLHYQMWLSDYISLMWEIKTRSFISVWNHLLNKMHISEIKSSLSPHVAMSIWWFVHDCKAPAFEQWKNREELYDERCENSPSRFEQNKLLHHNANE